MGGGWYYETRREIRSTTKKAPQRIAEGLFCVLKTLKSHPLNKTPSRTLIDYARRFSSQNIVQHLG